MHCCERDHTLRKWSNLFLRKIPFTLFPDSSTQFDRTLQLRNLTSVGDNSSLFFFFFIFPFSFFFSSRLSRWKEPRERRHGCDRCNSFKTGKCAWKRWWRTFFRQTAKWDRLKSGRHARARCIFNLLLPPSLHPVGHSFAPISSRVSPCAEQNSWYLCYWLYRRLYHGQNSGQPERKIASVSLPAPNFQRGCRVAIKFTFETREKKRRREKRHEDVQSVM